MALPENKISLLPAVSDFLYPDSLPYEPHKSYELGGAAIRNTTHGTNTFVWYVEYRDKNITVNKYPDMSMMIKENIEHVRTVDMAFDQNLNPAVCYNIFQHSYLYWFDSSIQESVTTIIPNCRDPRLTMDDKRVVRTSFSDILLVYIKDNGDLAYRQQRDRFTIERVLRSGIPDDVTLERVGMTVGNRIKFQFSKRYLLPLCTP